MNSIASFALDDGSITTDHVDLCDVAKVYFNNLYGSSNVDSNPIINQILIYLSFDDNSSSLAHFSIDEFKDVLFLWTQINPLTLMV